MKQKGLSLAEVLVGLAAICALAAISLPALVHNHKERQYTTGIKKGVSLLNNAISMNITEGHGSALKTTEANPLYLYLQNNIKTIKKAETSTRNSAHSEFYTPDGMRFEFPKGTASTKDEFAGLTLDGKALDAKGYSCGTKGLDDRSGIKARLNTPCVVLLDTNGDDPPNKLSDDSTNTLSDMVLILVTDKTAVPYGTVAQKAFYGR